MNLSKFEQPKQSLRLGRNVALTLRFHPLRERAERRRQVANMGPAQH
jgi:hypothetical protein